MKIEFEKQFGKGVDPWYAKAERWAKKQKFPISFLALGFIAYVAIKISAGNLIEVSSGSWFLLVVFLAKFIFL